MMNAVEIRNLTKAFGKKMAVNGLNMTVPQGAIYGFIGENGSGKSTTEKMLCGLLTPGGGSIIIMGQSYKSPEVRSKMGCLIEAPGCFPDLSVWNNLLIHARNLGISTPDEEVRRVLRIVRMDGSASNKYKNCSLGMKQRIGIATALMGDPRLLVLDEPLNGLDADGMRIMREVLTDITSNTGCTVVISSHLLNELEKIATHYGIIRKGRMIREMTAEELENDCPVYIGLKAANMNHATMLLRSRYPKVKDENGCLRIYDSVKPEEVVHYLYENGVVVSEIYTAKIGLEEYYMNLMEERSC